MIFTITLLVTFKVFKAIDWNILIQRPYFCVRKPIGERDFTNKNHCLVKMLITLNNV